MEKYTTQELTLAFKELVDGHVSRSNFDVEVSVDHLPSGRIRVDFYTEGSDGIYENFFEENLAELPEDVTEALEKLEEQYLVKFEEFRLRVLGAQDIYNQTI
jgi:hypothetical protein